MGNKRDPSHGHQYQPNSDYWLALGEFRLQFHHLPLIPETSFAFKQMMTTSQRECQAGWIDCEIRGRCSLPFPHQPFLSKREHNICPTFGIHLACLFKLKPLTFPKLTKREKRSLLVLEYDRLLNLGHVVTIKLRISKVCPLKLKKKPKIGP